MMHPFAVALDKFRDEAGLAGRVFDQLDDEAAEVEILPVEGSADLFVERFGAAQFDRKIFGEEIVGAVDRLHRDRNVIEPQADIVRRSHAETNLPSTKVSALLRGASGAEAPQ